MYMQSEGRDAMNTTELLRALDGGQYRPALAALYGPDGAPRAEARYRALAETFRARYGDAENAAFFSAPGRSEIGGNHTDHQGGHVLACAVGLDAAAVAARNGTDVIRIYADRYGENVVNVRETAPVAEETGRSNALVRGIAARLQALGHPIGGFDAVMSSEVLPGSGLSSSACFEVLVAGIASALFDLRLPPVALAQIAQYAENVYFGKPCGLMDPCACAAGGFLAMDFHDPASPAVERIACAPETYGYALCLIDAGGSHAGLTDEYAAIPEEMRSVARCFGHTSLSAVPRAEFDRALYAGLRGRVSDRAILRAMHFFAEDERAQQEAAALKDGDFERFLALVRASGASSMELLQNIYPAGDPAERSVALALALCGQLLGERGARRVHGGGFAGTVQAFVPLALLEPFREKLEGALGAGCCRAVSVRPVGFVQLRAEQRACHGAESVIK